MSHRFASPLPTTVWEFDRFCDSIFDAHGFPDNPSYRHAMASAIMHLGPVTDWKPKMFFAKSVKKAMANHAAYDKIRQLEAEEKAFMARANAPSSNGVKDVQEPASQVVS